MNDTEQAPGSSRGWSPHFPHARIDALLTQLRDVEVGGASEARDLLLLIAEEAERLRRAVARLASARLVEAEEEADRIVDEATRTARELRSLGRAALEARLTESEQLTIAIRDLVRVLGSEAPDARTARIPRPRPASDPASHLSRPWGPDEAH